MVTNAAYDQHLYLQPSNSGPWADLDLAKVLSIQVLDYVKAKTIPSSKIECKNEIGRGYFGIVYKGLTTTEYFL